MNFLKLAMLKFHEISIKWMLADIFFASFKNGWRVETFSKSHLLQEKFLIRIDDQDEEYKSMLYSGGCDYQPVALIDGKRLRKVVIETHKKLISKGLL